MKFRVSLFAFLSVLIFCLPLTAFAQVELIPGGTVTLTPESADPALFERNDGQGTCVGDAETCDIEFGSLEHGPYTDTIYVSAATGAGIESNIIVWGAIGQGFSTPAGSEGSTSFLNATFSGAVDIGGEVVTAVGFAGISAKAEIYLSVVQAPTGHDDYNYNDATAVPVFRHVLKSESCDGDFGADSICRETLAGLVPFSFDAQLFRGADYYLVLTAKCTTTSGLIGVGAACDLGKDLGFLGQHKVTWLGGTNISLQPDLFEVLSDIQGRLEALTTKVDNIQTSVDSLDASVQAKFDALDVNLQQYFGDLNAALDQHDADIKAALMKNNDAAMETIRLLHVPAGRRSSEIPACDEGPCEFPEN